MEMGTGKTRTALAIAHKLGCRRILIVAPLSVPGVWIREAGRVWPDLSITPYVEGNVPRRARLLSLTKPEGEPYAAIVNYEGYWREPLRTAIRKRAFDMVIYDEAHRLKSRGARHSTFAHLLAKEIKHRLGLTGTPMSNGPEDLYSIFKAIDPVVFGTRWDTFRDYYLKMGGFGGYAIVGYRHLSNLKARLKESSYRITKEDALDLPEQMDVLVPVRLRDMAVYEKLRKRSLAEVSGLLEDGTHVSDKVVTRSVITNILRLQQITSGYVRGVDHEVIELSTEKRDALRDLLDDATLTGRVVVFCRFTHDVEKAIEVAELVVGVVRTYRLDGSIRPKDREDVLDAFRSTDHGVLVVQVATGSLGIDLTCANIAVFFSVDYSLINFTQCRDRLHRMGQHSPVTYYHLIAEGTVDEKVYELLSDKRSLTSSITDGKSARRFFEN